MLRLRLWYGSITCEWRQTWHQESSSPPIPSSPFSTGSWNATVGASSRTNSGIAATREVWLYETDGVDKNGKKKLVRLLPNGEGMEGRAKEVALIERLGGRATIQTRHLLQQGLIVGLSMNSNSEAFEAFSSQFNKTMWHWSEHIYVVTDKGRAWWVE